MIWDFNPVAFSILGLPVRWYGLAYVFGFFLVLEMGYLILRRLEIKMPKKEWENFIFWTFVCGVVGGRLGEFIFYEPETFLRNPLEIFQIWHGGMSIHGGILGAFLFAWLWTRRQKISLLTLSDVVLVPLALALFFGRIANFLNGELVGIPTGSSWGVVFPRIDSLPRHPTQLYEAAKNLVLFSFLTFFLLHGFGKKKGFLTMVFLGGYGIFRFVIEFWKESPREFGIFSMGQVLCLLMIVGAFFIARSQKFWKKK